MSVSSFFHRVGSAMKKLFGSSTWEKSAQATISYVAPLLETIVQLSAGSGAEQAVASIIGKVQSDLATLSAVVDEANASTDPHASAVVATVLGSIRDNLSDLLGMAEIKNAGKVTEITAAVNLIAGEVNAMLGSLPASTPAAMPASTVPPPAKP